MKRRAESRVPAEAAGSRIESWLAGRFSYLDEAGWLRMLAEGRLRVDGAVAEAGRRLDRGELVAFDPPPRGEPEVDASYELLYEDGDFLVVDKPAFLPCHPGGAFFEHSLSRLLESRFGEVGIATRLDRETSGLVLACRGPAAMAAAQEQRSSGRLEKDYLALVHGSFPECIEARGFLLRDRASLVRKKMRYLAALPPGGDAAGPQPNEAAAAQACATEFRLERGLGAFSLVRARTLTGRTHQIRATLLELGYPIVGDKLYGLDELLFIRFSEGRLSEEDRARLVLPGQALHCASLAFEDSRGRRLRFESSPSWRGGP
ncbi:MAG TPA: RluA family pseudouridine synthase [Spirochaetia bacterium]|nr:RluA family pseudouridine synthase [Spirochaetia bacterium]